MRKTKAVEEIKTRVLCKTAFSENRAIIEITWKNMMQADRPQVTIQ
jgi:hypothetical protein